MKYGFSFFLLFLTGFLPVVPAAAQINVRDSLQPASMIQPSVAFAVPAGVLSQRFGPFVSVGPVFSHKTRSGLLWGVGGAYLFGQQVKEKDMVRHITTSDNFVIGADGTLYDLVFGMRGWQFDAHIGKLLPLLQYNRNSGPYVKLGAGYLQHKIRIETTEHNADVPQLARSYLKGYDRLSAGLAVSPALGYLFLGNKRLVNFFVQVEYTAAFARNARSYNFDQEIKETRTRNDGYMALRFGWTVPIYRKTGEEYYSF